MFTLTTNGKPFDPDDFKKTMLEAAKNKVKDHLHEQLSSIRHPLTGEFPVVQVLGPSLEDLSARIEGSAGLLELVRERISPEDLDNITLIETASDAPPKAFLSFGWEDRELAKAIAEALQANGIDTWWAEWEIRAGDSLRRKIDEGLSNCTVFLVLLTPESIDKPWVNQEMDAGLIRKIEERARFIPVRKNLPPSALPPLLRGMLSPALEDFEEDVRQLIADIHGVSRKPVLGPTPQGASQEVNTGHSPAATAVARLFVEGTQHALHFDPVMSVGQIGEATALPEDDLADALYEMRNMVEDHHGSIVPLPELFVTFDKFFKEWDPAADGLRLAADFLNDADFPSEPDKIAQRYGWEPRRLNPALSYLINRKLIQSITVMAMGPWVAIHFGKTDATRRFVKSRQ
jgi:hypothetical protein